MTIKCPCGAAEDSQVDECAYANCAMKTALSNPPVAYQNIHVPTEIYSIEEWEYIDPAWHTDYRPLYAQPERQPLTYKEVFDLILPLCHNESNCHAIISNAMDEYRAIERAHGIV